MADCAPYIADARTLRLPLIGGKTGAEVDAHDWEYMLGRLNLLEYDQSIATGFLWTGRLIMLAGLAVCIACVVRQILTGRSNESATS